MQVHRSGPVREEPVWSLVLPAFNPGAVVEETWSELAKFLNRQTEQWEILFVCDGCTDGSAERLTSLTRAAADCVRVLSYSPNRGKGYAVRRGLEAARGQWRIFTDVDLAYGFDDILRVATTLRAGADVAIASRLHRDSRLSVPPALQGYAYRRYLQSQVFSAVVRRLLGLPFGDTQAGLKGMAAGAARAVLPLLRCNGFEFDCELLTASRRLGLRIEEVPVCVRCESSGSTTSLSATARMLREIWKIRREWKGRSLSSHDSRAGQPNPDRTQRQAA